MGTRGRRMGRVFSLGIMGFLLAIPAIAPARAEDDARGATYARVRYLEGRVTIQRTPDGEISEATINSPVAPGDGVWIEGGRAEIELADATLLRLDDGTRLDVRSLSDVDDQYEKSTLLALERGSVRIDLRQALPADGSFQIDSQAGTIYLLSPGTFRIDADAGVTTVSSFRGVAEVSGDSGSVLVRSGERSSVRGGRAPAEPRHFNTLRQDDFDQFCDERDETYLGRATDDRPDPDVEQSVPPEVHPYVGELSVYGAWHSVPTYGWVWRPTYYGSWGPYVNGHWTWCPVGWVWVSDDAWGWAPYHYGRWDFMVDLGWVWIPGRRWSGAWVSFAVGPSYVGWCPLNFYNRPVFHDAGFVNVVNINVTRLDPRGWRFVPTDRFSERTVQRTFLRGDRLPRGTEAVVTRTLPQFNPRSVTARPERGQQLAQQVRAARVPLPAPAAATGQPVPFRELERGPRQGRGATGTPGQTDRPSVRQQRRPDLPAPSPPARGGISRSPAVPRLGPGTDGTPRGSVNRPQSRAPRTDGNPRFIPDPTAPPRTVPPPSAPPRADRPRGHAVERLFDGARRQAPTPNVAPPRPEPRSPSRPPEAKPKPEPKREERPPREKKHR